MDDDDIQRNISLHTMLYPLSFLIILVSTSAICVWKKKRRSNDPPTGAYIDPDYTELSNGQRFNRERCDNGKDTPSGDEVYQEVEFQISNSVVPSIEPYSERRITANEQFQNIHGTPITEPSEEHISGGSNIYSDIPEVIVPFTTTLDRIQQQPQVAMIFNVPTDSSYIGITSRQPLSDLTTSLSRGETMSMSVHQLPANDYDESEELYETVDDQGKDEIMNGAEENSKIDSSIKAQQSSVNPTNFGSSSRFNSKGDFPLIAPDALRNVPLMNEGVNPEDIYSEVHPNDKTQITKRSLSGFPHTENSINNSSPVSKSLGSTIQPTLSDFTSTTYNDKINSNSNQSATTRHYYEENQSSFNPANNHSPTTYSELRFARVTISPPSAVTVRESSSLAHSSNMVATYSDTSQFMSYQDQSDIVRDNTDLNSFYYSDGYDKISDLKNKLHDTTAKAKSSSETKSKYDEYYSGNFDGYDKIKEDKISKNIFQSDIHRFTNQSPRLFSAIQVADHMRRNAPRPGYQTIKDVKNEDKKTESVQNESNIDTTATSISEINSTAVKKVSEVINSHTSERPSSFFKHPVIYSDIQRMMKTFNSRTQQDLGNGNLLEYTTINELHSDGKPPNSTSNGTISKEIDESVYNAKGEEWLYERLSSSEHRTLTPTDVTTKKSQTIPKDIYSATSGIDTYRKSDSFRKAADNNYAEYEIIPNEKKLEKHEKRYDNREQKPFSGDSEMIYMDSDVDDSEVRSTEDLSNKEKANMHKMSADKHTENSIVDGKKRHFNYHDDMNEKVREIEKSIDLSYETVSKSKSHKGSHFIDHEHSYKFDTGVSVYNDSVNRDSYNEEVLQPINKSNTQKVSSDFNSNEKYDYPEIVNASIHQQSNVKFSKKGAAISANTENDTVTNITDLYDILPHQEKYLLNNYNSMNGNTVNDNLFKISDVETKNKNNNRTDEINKKQRGKSDTVIDVLPVEV